MRIHLSRPEVTEEDIEAVCSVLRGPNLSLGPKLSEFEGVFADYIGRKRAVAVNSGTSGLFLSMLALGIGSGDEVITTPFTFIASATSIMMSGARPVFVDIDSSTLNMAPDAIAEKIGPRTKGILPVEIFGNPAGIEQAAQIAEENNLPVIEDSCEALGSELAGKKAGTFGTVSLFAFYPNKQITTGEGGMILTDDDEVADLCVSLRNQGRSKQGGWLGHIRLGYNFRLSDINCALGISQLKRIGRIISKRCEVARWYRERLKDDARLIAPVEPAGAHLSWFVFVVRLSEDYTLEQRDVILTKMAERGIQVSNYFPPVHLQPFISEQFGYREGDFPVTESVSARTIALPFYNDLAESEVEVVCTELKEILDNL